jgi:FKBP-type peptidyl-prolyl cis-trans isomerase SlyD
MKVVQDCVVELSYDLYLGEDKEAVETFSIEEPLDLLIGAEEMLPAFEKSLIGKRLGEEFDILIKEKDAFGPYDESLILEMDAVMFAENPVEEGELINLESEDQTEYNALVLEVNKENVLVDLNHPFAGEDLHFVGQILSIRLD